MRNRNLREINKYIHEKLYFLNNKDIVFNSLECDDVEWDDFYVQVNGGENAIFFKHLRDNLFWMDYSPNAHGTIVNMDNDFMELITI